MTKYPRWINRYHRLDRSLWLHGLFVLGDLEAMFRITPINGGLDDSSSQRIAAEIKKACFD